MQTLVDIVFEDKAYLRVWQDGVLVVNKTLSDQELYRLLGRVTDALCARRDLQVQRGIK